MEPVLGRTQRKFRDEGRAFLRAAQGKVELLLAAQESNVHAHALERGNRFWTFHPINPCLR
jgi:hypothetical protein